ncbi:MAG: exodeoxyribonuclease III [Bacteroidales bacterium]|nr:exodeoxyribonuclease III [Candidatus Cryptobacteroides aphodequi]
MKLVSWNVNGLRAVAGKGFADIFEGFEADCVCLQETKLQAGQIDLEFLGYESFWNYAEKKGYSGTAIYTRVRPLSAWNGIGQAEHDSEGRVITLEFEDFYLVDVYVPNSQDGLRRLDYRMSWEDAFRAYVSSLDAGTCPGHSAKPVVICGDMNVAHEEIDLKNPATNHFNAGFSDEERGKMSELLAAGFTDSWRLQHPGEAKYSWWSYRMAARERNVGWRIDYFLCSDSLRPRIVSTDILNDVLGSDHCPVVLELSL